MPTEVISATGKTHPARIGGWSMDQAIGVAIFVLMAWLLWRAFRRVPPVEPVEVALRVIDAGGTRLLDVRGNPAEVLSDPRALEALCAQAQASPRFRGMQVWVFPASALAAWPTTDRGAAALATVLFAGGSPHAQGISVPDGELPPAVARAAEALRVHQVRDLQVIGADGRTIGLSEMLRT
jgi:hypothetical protein